MQINDNKFGANRTGYRKKSCCLIGATTALLALAGVILHSYHSIKEANLYQVTLGEKLNEQLGFVSGSPYLRVDGAESGVEVFTLEKITSGGPFALAGVKEGDLPTPAGTDFYRMLHEGRGTTVTFTVVKGGDGPSLEKRRTRTIKVYVPADTDNPAGLKPPLF